MPKGLNDSILTGKDGPGLKSGPSNNAPPSQLQMRAAGYGSSALDYDDPLYTESACQNYTNKVSGSPLDMAEPVQMMNSKPLLVSELVNNYKGINTSTISEPSASISKAAGGEPASNKVIADYANESMNNAVIKGSVANAKNYTIIEESADEHDPE